MSRLSDEVLAHHSREEAIESYYGTTENDCRNCGSHVTRGDFCSDRCEASYVEWLDRQEVRNA